MTTPQNYQHITITSFYSLEESIRRIQSLDGQYGYEVKISSIKNDTGCEINIKASGYKRPTIRLRGQLERVHDERTQFLGEIQNDNPNLLGYLFFFLLASVVAFITHEDFSLVQCLFILPFFGLFMFGQSKAAQNDTDRLFKKIEGVLQGGAIEKAKHA